MQRHQLRSRDGCTCTAKIWFHRKELEDAGMQLTDYLGEDPVCLSWEWCATFLKSAGMDPSTSAKVLGLGSGRGLPAGLKQIS